MTQALLPFETNKAHYNGQGNTQLSNCCAEKIGNDGKAPLAIVPSDGIIELTDTGMGPCRGMIYLPDLDKLYHIHPSGAYKTTYDGTTATTTRIGTVPGVDQVQLARNQNASPQVSVQSENGVQFISSDSLSYSADVDFPSDVVTAEYVHGYHAYGLEDRRYFISSIDDAKVIDALDFSTFKQRAGKLIRIVESSGEMVGFCNEWLEFHRDTGNTDFPFQEIGFKSRGLKSKNSVVRCDGTLMFHGNDNVLYRLNNYDPQRISMHGIERLLRDDPAPEDVIGCSWATDGHAHASWTGTDWTRCYDAATGVFHSRESYGSTRWRVRHAVDAWGLTIVDDATSGKLGYLDRGTFTEYGDPIIWKVVSPPMHVFPNGGIIDAIHFDLATGYGLLSGQGSDPKIMLRISKDGGNTFGQYREISLGIVGKYATRVTSRRLGKFGPKGVVYELSISDPVARGLVGVDFEIRPLKK